MKTNKKHSGRTRSRAHFRSLITKAAAWCAITFILLCPAVRAQDIYVSVIGDGSIYKFTPGGVQSTFASGLNTPYGLAFDNAGNLYEADQGSGNIFKFTPSGVQSTFASLNNEMCQPVLDQAGNLYISDNGYYQQLLKFAPNGISNVVSYQTYDVNSYAGLAFDSAGNLYVADNGTTGAIYEYSTNGVRTTFASGLSHPFGLAFDNAGNLFVNDDSGNIYKYATNGVQSIFATGANGLNIGGGLAVDRAGNLFAVEQSAGNIYKYTPDGARSIFASGLNGPIWIAIAPLPSFSVSIKMFAGIILNNGQIGSNYFIQATSNPSSSNWITLTNLTLPTNPYIYIDYSSPTNSQQFYRALPQ